MADRSLPLRYCHTPQEKDLAQCKANVTVFSPAISDTVANAVQTPDETTDQAGIIAKLNELIQALRR